MTDFEEAMLIAIAQADGGSGDERDIALLTRLGLVERGSLTRLGAAVRDSLLRVRQDAAPRVREAA